MQNFELTREEMEVLREVFEHAMNELDIEIGRTDTHDFKDKLKRRRVIMDQILVKLASAPAMT
jgi:hypothetical protein